MAVSTNQNPGGAVVPRRLTRWRKAQAMAVLAAMRLLMKSWRLHWKDADRCPVVPGPVIFCTWHNRLALAMAANGDFVREKWPSAGLCAMISASRDGAFLASLVEPFGVVPIRGSTSRRGPQALLEATTWMEKNYSIAITPDGPRGPAYKIQDGDHPPGPIDRPPDYPDVQLHAVQDHLPKLGQIPNPPALRPLRIPLGRAALGAARRHGGGPGAIARRAGAGDDGDYNRLIHGADAPAAAAGGRAGGAMTRGRVKWKEAPLPGSLLTQASPPWA